MASKTTLSTIAEHLGVSTATVSLALRDSPLVAEATRQKIKASAIELGYIYNRRAASLRTSRSGIIGVLVHDIMNPFFAEILLAIEDELGANRQTFLLCNHRDDLTIQTDFIGTLLQFGADGVIVSPAIGTTAVDIAKIEANGLPVVMIARSVPDCAVPVFRGDDKHGIHMATSHLLELGHREIAFIGGRRETSTGRDRREGYLAAMHERGIEPEAAWQIGSEATRKAGYDSVRTMFEGGVRPTGIVCFNDLVAIGVMSGLRSMGIEPGIDIAVTGYDDISEAEIASPALTTVWNGQQEVGRLAARAMLSIISGKEAPRKKVLVAPKLKVRASSCPPPAEVRAARS
ncbi:MAG: LacI family DNA-binding transcriptional regulator [Nitratireductor sp.]|nr:LacI family DNA-binding transcriptional regulator [Nitratireductor sp.]